MCVNCLDDCAHGAIAYRTRPSADGENTAARPLPPRVHRLGRGRAGRRARACGWAASPGPNWNPGLIRPPGALAEEEFLARCIKCGQCMRVCPTNVIHPAGLEGRAGRPLDADAELPHRHQRLPAQLHRLRQRLPDGGHPAASAWTRSWAGQSFAGRGPIRIGTAFVDRGRCLPWAMDKPCIVCQENCPVSPKAIFTREVFTPVRAAGPLTVARVERNRIVLATETLAAERFGTGDYYALFPGGRACASPPTGRGGSRPTVSPRAPPRRAVRSRCRSGCSSRWWTPATASGAASASTSVPCSAGGPSG